MGINADNLFIENSDRVTISSTLSKTFERKWRVAISDPNNGWVQIIEEHDTSPPELAKKISLQLRSTVICAQLYETAGEIACYKYMNGEEIKVLQVHETDDPYGELEQELISNKIHTKIQLFRHVVQEKIGWHIMKSTEFSPNKPLQVTPKSGAPER